MVSCLVLPLFPLSYPLIRLPLPWLVRFVLFILVLSLCSYWLFLFPFPIPARVLSHVFFLSFFYYLSFTLTLVFISSTSIPLPDFNSSLYGCSYFFSFISRSGFFLFALPFFLSSVSHSNAGWLPFSHVSFISSLIVFHMSGFCIVSFSSCLLVVSFLSPLSWWFLFPSPPIPFLSHPLFYFFYLPPSLWFSFPHLSFRSSSFPFSTIVFIFLLFSQWTFSLYFFLLSLILCSLVGFRFLHL